MTARSHFPILPTMLLGVAPVRVVGDEYLTVKAAQAQSDDAPLLSKHTLSY